MGVTLGDDLEICQPVNQQSSAFLHINKNVVGEATSFPKGSKPTFTNVYHVLFLSV